MFCSLKATTVREEPPYPNHPDRFDFLYGILCVNGLTGHCYWEVEREGWLSMSDLPRNEKEMSAGLEGMTSPGHCLYLENLT